MKFEVIVKKVEKPNSMVLLLPGRGQSPQHIMASYNFNRHLRDSVLVAIKPTEEWYPIPKGAKDQKDAVLGMTEVIPRMQKFIEKLKSYFRISNRQIGIAGFSAGAVIAMQIAIHSTEPFAGVVSHAGAILEPDCIPYAKNETPFLLIHSEDDACFSWQERYLPMKRALEDKNYIVHCRELTQKGHSMTEEDIDIASFFLCKQFDNFQDA